MNPHPTWTVPADASADEAAFATELAHLIGPARACAASCPTPELVAAAEAGALPDELQSRVAAHVEGCPLCRTLAQAGDERDDVTTSDVERVWKRVAPGKGPDDRTSTGGEPPAWRVWWSWRPALATFALAASVVVAVGVSMLRLQVPPAPGAPGIAVTAPWAGSVLALDRPAVDWPVTPAVLWRGRRAAPRVTDGLEAAMAAYDAGQFGEAADRLARILGREPGLHAARLALAVSLLHTGRSREARAVLLPLSESGVSALADEARWYSALAALREGDDERAAGTLRFLCGGAGRRAAQACLGVDELSEPVPPSRQPR